jgi:hypothetical protein
MGQWLERWMRSRGFTTGWLARVMKVTTSTARKMYDRETFALDDIRKISIATGTDLFVFLLSRQEAETLAKAKQLASREKAEAEQKAKLQTQLQMQQQIDDLVRRMTQLEAQLGQQKGAA